MRIVTSIVLTFVIMNAATFVSYGSFSHFLGLEPPAGATPGELFLSAFVVKVGMAVGFVLLFVLAKGTWVPRWRLYAFIWWIMFAVTETGMAIGPNYSPVEAVAGTIAEALYFPFSALVTARVVGRGSTDDRGEPE